MLLGGLSAKRFLREHWQKKPLLVRGALPDFRDPLSPDELAGLACEDGVESRIVRARGWRVTYGPQDERVFAKLGARGWTLLVQEVNRWVPDAALLLDRFGFVPNVRVDDIMVSYAARGGGVGPHLDSYDVFLVQGEGKRRWRWSERLPRNARFRAGLELRILENAELERDEVLERGDMLYLPPGFAHEGTAVTPCLTYSVGFRSPNLGELWRDFAESHLGGATLLVDPPLAPAENPGAIPKSMLARVRRAVRSLDAPDDALDRWFARFATRLKPGHDLEAPRRVPSASAIATRRAAIERTEEGRWAYLDRPRGALYLYVAGHELDVPHAAAALAKKLCASRRHDTLTAPNPESRDLLVALFAIGALHFVPRQRGREP
ncbi:MAG TPA: cupin domain-containing protein [Labilithrix sp.]